MAENVFNPKQIRLEYFLKEYKQDSNLLNILNTDNREFDFLKNPAVQHIYNYQIDYVCNFSKAWFGNNSFSILDWGCGKGHVSYWLIKKGMTITSCDVSNTGVTSAFGIDSPIIKNININVVELKHEYILPFPNESFHVVLSFGVLEHVSNDLESLKEIKRILKPGGLFFCFYLPYKFSYTQNIQHLRGQWYHDKLYSKNHIKRLLENTNLDVMDIWHRALFPKISIRFKNYHKIEKIDNWLCNNTILKYLATNIEFVASKGKLKPARVHAGG
ncbi:MAG: class I SAM-dependent methyltransferase [Treponema sp.]|jgi:SAM-dependent methyltransferase|nr:class I SAM-dependent methyltransferase [Treponema sp.]